MDLHIIKKGKREQSYKKLKNFMINPGRFSLTVLGDRGVGKKHAIKKVYQDLEKNKNNYDCLAGINFIDAIKFPDSPKRIDNLLKKNQMQILVVEDVDLLKTDQQRLLFKAMETLDGYFGIKSKSFKLRIVFTSSAPIESLRTTQEHLLGYFWDRISQLIVYFPNFEEESALVVSYFKSIWKKMKFEEIKDFKHLSSTPSLARLESFLENNCAVFEGNFRDLDKLAIMYFNYRIFHYNDSKKISKDIEEKVLTSVKNDFLEKSQLKTPTHNDLSYFKIREGFTMEELKKQFRNRVKEWGKNKYKTITAAEEKLGLSAGTMKNYK